MRIDLSGSKALLDAWGSPRTIIGLREEPFGSKSEMRKWCRDRNIVQSESADKHHGSRVEKEQHGKLFSGAGMSRRGGYSKEYGSYGR